MNIIIAPDSFKGSLSSKEAADAMEKGIKRVCKNISTTKIPLADGGEGTVEALVSALEGRMVERVVTGPLGNEVKACFGILKDGKTAVIEMAQASGLPLVPPEQRNPLITTTYGTGELIKKALDEGCKRVLIGIGGSATNDGGAGMAQALGVKLLDDKGKEIGLGGGELIRLSKIDRSGIDKRLKNVSVEVMCDVTNPLIGPTGASYVYGPQKGADANMVRVLEANLTHFARVIKRDLYKDIANIPGAGAAGGLGGGLVAFLNAQLKKGIDIILEVVNFEKHLNYADIVLTGEGQIDKQTLCGKTLYGVCELARKQGVPVIAITGSIEEDGYELFDSGLAGIESIVDRPMTLVEAMERADELIEKAAERVMRFLLINKANITSCKET